MRKIKLVRFKPFGIDLEDLQLEQETRVELLQLSREEQMGLLKEIKRKRKK